jgi:hypothetical protein
MTSIRPCDLPDSALLRRYREKAYTDCYVTEIAGTVSRAVFVEAFYTTALFKAERALLACLLARPSCDAQARQLAQGEIGRFAAWRVEGRDAQQLLLGDETGRTKSWLMVAPVERAGIQGTHLYFGSAVVGRRDARTGKLRLGLAFHALLGFHRMYSRLLLGAARSRVASQRETRG